MQTNLALIYNFSIKIILFDIGQASDKVYLSIIYLSNYQLSVPTPIYVFTSVWNSPSFKGIHLISSTSRDLGTLSCDQKK